MPSVLITGCDTGIGREFARQYAMEGWEVWATYLDMANRLELNDDLCTSHHYQLDVTKADDFLKLKQVLADRPLDILLSNAGIGMEQTGFGNIDYAYIERMYLTNSIGPLRLIETFIDNLAASEMRRFVAISSRMGSINANLTGGHYGYRASKAALNAMLRSLTLDLSPQKICVVAFHPGAVAVPASPDSPVSAETAIRSMRHIIEQLGPHESGQFYRFDGTPLPW